MTHVVVVGSGVIGLSTAFFLTQRGAKVTIVESHAGPHGASVVNAGWICPSFSDPVPSPGLVQQSIKWMRHPDSPLYIKPSLDFDFLRWLLGFWRNCNSRAYTAGVEANAALNKQTFPLFDQMRNAGVKFEEHHDGILFAYHSPAKLEHDYNALAPYAKFGIKPGEPMWGLDLKTFEPSLSLSINGGFWYSGERSVRPDTLTGGLIEWLSERNVTFKTNARVVDFERSNGKIASVRTERESVAADAFVIAAGAWTGSLTKKLGRALPIQGGKGYSLDYEPPPTEVTHPIDFGEARFACTPMNGRVRLAGTMELSGINDVVRRERVAAIARGASKGLRDWPSDPSVARMDSGLRPMTPDGLAVLGWLPGHSNVAIATGHAMLGVTLGASSGDAIAEMVTTGKAPAVLEPFRVERFG